MTELDMFIVVFMLVVLGVLFVCTFFKTGQHKALARVINRHIDSRKWKDI